MSLPPGPPSSDMWNAAAFRRHHEERRRSFLAAATSTLYSGSIIQAYHYDVLTAAKGFLNADMDNIAVIMAQTSTEIAIQEMIGSLLVRQRFPADVETWMRERIERSSTLKSGALYDLYKALTGDDLRGNAIWPTYVRHIDLRNRVVHRGAHATKIEAAEACDTAEKLIRHFETVISRCLPATS